MRVQVHFLGPPAPPCEEERDRTAKLLGCINQAAELQHEDPGVLALPRA